MLSRIALSALAVACFAGAALAEPANVAVAGAKSEASANPAKIGCANPATEQHPKAVFQVNDPGDVPLVLRVVTNYLIAEPTAEVAVVGYGGGIDFMLKGAVDPNGKPYAIELNRLADRGVAFKVCNNTLKARNLSADAVAPMASVVPSAVIEIVRLQTHEGFAYFKP